MTRPKVPDDKRQRTAQACDSCKRRKQKCNGQKPCQTCSRRKLSCSYTPNSAADHVSGESAGSPTKRRHIETSPTSITAVLETAETSPVHYINPENGSLWEKVQAESLVKTDSPTSTTAAHPPLFTHDFDRAKRALSPDSEDQSGSSSMNGQHEEAAIYSETRMLQDQTGRLLYVGDASSLSVLQLIRIIVENTAGAEIGSPLIHDPKRHRIMENLLFFSEKTRIPGCLPDKETADVLVDSYFTNTCGLVEIFDKEVFLKLIDKCYQDPLSADNDFLCHLFLVLALGLVLAAPPAGSREEAVIKYQQEQKQDRAEIFFRSAKAMCDPETGFEDADFWSVQALSLMTVYMLAVSKRNTAYAYLGMAVRSAYALGLHREETMNELIFSKQEMRVRRNLWKSLFILDRFLAASLGRPTAISEDDCSCKIMPEDNRNHPATFGGLDPECIHFKSIDSCVRSCHVIGVTLKVFSQRKISHTVVQEIADKSRYWDLNLSRNQAEEPPANPAHGIAALHVNLLALHSLLLLTRQVFMMHIWRLTVQRSKQTEATISRETALAKYSEACVIVSYHSIYLVQKAREAKYLPQRNPFIIYFLFAASLVVFVNQFACLYHTDAYEQTIHDATEIMRYCAQTDPQAARLLEIIEKFTAVVANYTPTHRYPAPVLSANLNGLYSRGGSGSRYSREHTGSVASVSSPQGHESSRVNSLTQQGLMNSPPAPRPHRSEFLVPQPPAAAATTGAGDVRMNGMSPQHTTTTTNTTTASPSMAHGMATRPSISSHSTAEGSESMSRDFEFDFNSLWNNWRNGIVHTPNEPTGIASITALFPPMVHGTAPPHSHPPVAPPTTEAAFGPFPMATEPQMSPTGIRGDLPLYRHSSGFG